MSASASIKYGRVKGIVFEGEQTMSNQQILMIIGVVCLVICAALLFVAVERYQTNANNVKAMNQMQQGSPMGGMGGMLGPLKPATPAATKYAAAGAVLSGIVGVVLLVMSRKKA
ncbi:MAG: hypothetical protein JXA82_08835 [Sedimentisphaerales bacterium]|nr:hypothetical protein [Sedimentisphaerales bacterium]